MIVIAKKSLIAGLLLAVGLTLGASRARAAAAVTLTEDAATYTLDNGIVTATVAKASGDLVSLRYKNLEMLATFLTPDGKPDLERDPPGANPNGLNRGMRYDMEMSQYAGERHRVQMRVERLINEQTGKMIPMKTPCIQLEDIYCRATCTEKRLGCPRASNTYWREIWLRRVDGPHTT